MLVVKEGGRCYTRSREAGVTEGRCSEGIKERQGREKAMEGRERYTLMEAEEVCVYVYGKNERNG